MDDLAGFIDPHIHAAPEHIPRLLDDIALTRQAHETRMAGILIKSHTTLTADRAFIAQKLFPHIRVWGGLVLNQSVGGLNPAAVETALAYGAAEIWMPTLDADNHRRFHGETKQGIALPDDSIPDAVHEIMRLIAAKDVILGTGHLSVAEICTIVRIAQEHGVRKILITHPEAPFINMPLSVQHDLAHQGCRFERTWVFTTPVFKRIVTPERIMEDIWQVGYESTVLATDMGQVGNPSPVDGFRAYVHACKQASFSEREIRRMGATNIAEWLPSPA